MKALLTFCAAMLPAAVAAQEVTVTTATGEATVPTSPETVAVFDLAALDTLDALGVEVDGVPDAPTVSFLEGVMTDTRTVGTLFEPDLEELAVLSPDLIVAGGRSRTQVESLSEIATTIDMSVDAPDLIESAKARTTAYGEIFERPDDAEALITGLEEDLSAARSAIEGKGDAMILMTNGGNVSVYGPGSRFGWLHDSLGLPATDDTISVENHGEAVSFEYIAEQNPDWLLVIDRGAAIGQDGEAAAATLDNSLVDGTTAGQEGQIVYLDSAPLYLSGGGIQSIRHTLGQITEAFGAGGT